MLKGKGRSECIPLLFIGSSKGVFKHRSSAGSGLFALDFDETISARLKINLIAPLTLTSSVAINVPTRSALALVIRLILFVTPVISVNNKKRENGKSLNSCSRA